MTTPSIFDPTSPPQPERDPEQIAAEIAGIRSRLKRGPAGEAILDEQLVTELAKLVGEGQTLETGCKVCGLRRPTLSRWIKQGLDDIDAEKDTVQARLAWAIDQALGAQEVLFVRGVVRGVRTDSRLALEVLGRRRPADWAPAAPEREDFRAQYSKMSEADLIAEMDRLRAAAARSATDREPPALPPHEPTEE